MTKQIFTAGLCMSMVLLHGCGNMKSMSEALRVVAGSSVTFVEPPESRELQQVNALALSASGAANQLLPDIQRQLGSAKVGQEPYFKAVTAGAASAGDNLKWADVAVSATLGNVREERFTENKFRCPGNKVVNKCSSKEAVQYQAQCQSRTINGEANLIAKDRASGRALLTRNANKSLSSKVCNDENGSLETAESLQQRLQAELSKELIAGLTPKYIKRPLDLIEDSKSMSEQDNAKLGRYYKLAASGSLDSACKGYQGMQNDTPGNGIVLFNLGYCEHVVGNFLQAKQLYARAGQSGNVTPDLLAKYAGEADDWVGQGIAKVAK
ncbi:MAG: hypothetical protein EKK59_08915 [Neisseriaceae bacterium]|jgi:hypothetical protein|nr:MAG: hypothetical protein EKK59_08915 [Neisseriaceae bacterium]